MKKIFLTFTISLLILSCKKQANKENIEQDQSQTTNTISTSADKGVIGGFDINTIKESTADLGTFPYLNPPDTYTYGFKKEINTNDISDFDKEYFAVAGKLIPIEGKSFKTYIEKNRSDGKRFNSLIVGKSYEEAILALGGVKVNDSTIPKSEIERVGNKELITKHFGYSIDYNMLDDIKTYVIKTKDKEIWIQYYLINDESGRITILEKSKLQTLAISTISANQMKTDIKKNGKTILNINFDIDKASLKTDGEKIVEEITALLKSNPDLKLSIEGHTDNSGIANKNKQLSTDRATTVLNKLVKSGIDKSRLKATGYGSEKPLVANISEENKAKNRRVELVKF